MAVISIIAGSMKKTVSSSNSQGDAQAATGFSYSRAFFKDLVEQALSHAKTLGATDAGADASEGAGLSVSVRKGELETVERNRDKSLGVTVYIGKRRGNASTSDFSDAALESTVRAAHDIAKYTAADDCAGLPDKEYLVDANTAQQDLDLYHPWALTTSEAIRLARECEDAAYAASKYIKNSEGGSVNTSSGHFIAAASSGFMGGFAYSRHSLGAMPIASKGREMERDAWFVS